ncbi:MAG: hypothetical protein QXI58_00490 [Candidatus Micrarchaeia archaeon]
MNFEELLADLALLTIWRQRGLPITPNIASYLEKKYRHTPFYSSIIASYLDEDFKVAQRQIFENIHKLYRSYRRIIRSFFAK